MSFLGEIKRRKMFQVASTYAVVAWLLVQVVATIQRPLQLPEWFETAIIVLLAAGFPVALIISWAFDVTPDGLVRDEGGAPARPGGHRIEYLLLGLLVIAGGWIGYREIGFANQSSGASAGAVSIAVLPFVNLSADPQQEFFSDGMTEEISSVLAKVKGLAVVGRTSSFQFKGEAKDLREIGRALGASFLMEGSVRKSGNLVRITAKLIRADSGVEIWTNSYDREMADVFAIQEEIARNVAASLQAPLGLQQEQRLVTDRTIDADSYEQYLRARALFHSRGLKALKEAAALLERLVERSPDYAPAWALLAQAYDFIPNFDPAWFSGDFESLRPQVLDLAPKAEMAARRAIELDPNLASGYYSLALALEQRGRYAEAEDLYRQALTLDPSDPDALHLYSRMLACVGRLEKALAMRERLSQLDPFVPVYRAVTAFVLWLNGRDDEAIAIANALPPLHRGYVLSRIMAANGRYDDAADVVSAFPDGTFLPGTVEDAARLLQSAPAKTPLPQSLPRLGVLEYTYLYVGAPERVFEVYEGGVDVGYSVSVLNALFWHSSYAELRKTQRFKAFLRNAGIVDYWRDRGWPDLCQPVGSDDFVCN